MNKNHRGKETIYKDVRGEIRIYEIDGMEFKVLFTKAGGLRSGDIHPDAQHDLILKGKLEITLRKNNRNVVVQKGPNEMITIPSNTPHLFKSLTNSIMIEWRDGDYKAEYYEPYRKLIEKQLKHGARQQPSF